MNRSEQINELSTALCAAQAEMRPAEMNRINPFLKNKYADLGAIIAAARQPLAKNGLSFTQLLNDNGAGSLTIETVLMHKSGQYIGAVVTIPIAPQAEKGRSMAQEAGAIITYFRRYALASLLGIYADEDSDGDVKKPAPKAEAAEPAAHALTQLPMTYDEACSTKNSEGISYGELGLDKLGHMARSINKRIRDNGLSPEEVLELHHKLQAIETIMSHG